MIFHILNYKVQALLVVLATLILPITLKNNFVAGIDRDIEEWNLILLEKAQNMEGVKIQPFVSDGCSGGLSEGWRTFASLFPAFKEEFGKKPPWEACCVEHDRAYWRGEVKDGFNKRLKADETLRQCVIDYGARNSQRLSEQLSIDRQKIETQFELTADLMYRAVRIGGKPCSMLPWRWGYGWPHCTVLPYPSDSESDKKG
jgi:hypothetical protein